MRGASEHRFGVCAVAAFAAALALAGPLATGASAQAAPTYRGPAFGDFRSVLAGGEGQTVNALDLAAYEGSGQPPESFVDQQPLYVGVTGAAATLGAGDLDSYYKDTNFGSMPGGVGSLTQPRPGVRIYRDATYEMAHIYGATREDVLFGAGYATAQERLFLMDALRRTAKGTLAGLVGPSAAAGDASQLTDQDFSERELRAQFEALPARFGAEGEQAHSDLLDYVAGINAYIDDARLDPSLMPAEYAALGATPARWDITDTAAMAVLLVTQFTVSNGSEEVNSILEQGFEDQFGHNWQRRYRDFREAEDPQSYTVAKQPFLSDRPGPVDGRLNADVDPDSLIDRNNLLEGPSDAEQRAAAAKLPEWGRALLGLRASLPPVESNAVLVTRKLSSDGRPLAAMGPQVSYYSPQIFSEYELHGGGIDVEGVSFPGASPFPLIGHGIDFSWSGTSANGDNEDTFLERLCEPDGSKPSFDSTHYRYRGKCIPFVSRDQTVTTPVSPLDPQPPQQITYRTLRSVHGPVFKYATVAGKPVALAKAKGVDFHELDGIIPFMRLAENKATSAKSFMRIMGGFPGTENWFYVDNRDVAFIQSGRYPRHASGSNVDLPFWGDGRADWQRFDPAAYTFRTIPPSHRPRALNPDDGFIISWNNKEAPGWRKGPREWSNGPVHRALILQRRLLDQARGAGGKVDLAALARAVNLAATTDLRGEDVLPWMRRVIGDAGGLDGRLLASLQSWHQAGSNRLDADGDNVYEHSDGVALMDAWWPRFVEAEFSPALGERLFDAVEGNVLSLGGDFGWDWASAVQKDLRNVLGKGGRSRRDGRLSQIYCGGPEQNPRTAAAARKARRGCRKLLLSTLRDAYREVAAAQGSDDPGQWQVEAICDAGCDQIEPNTAGAVETPAFPWQNRGTYHQIIELGGHR